MTSPPYIVHIDDVREEEGCYPAPFDAEKLSIYRDLGRAAGTRHAGFGYERLLPGRRTSFTHAHELEEEFVFVLAGSCHVRIVDDAGTREHALRPGHAVAFPAGTGIAHVFVNRGTEECVLLVHGERRAAERVYYPDDPAYDAHHASSRPHKHWHRGPVRAVRPEEVPLLLEFLRHKAAFDASHTTAAGTLTATEDGLRDSLFGVAPYAFARFIEHEGAVAGFTLFYFRFSSFRGRPSLWLDDVLVLDALRGRRLGEALMRDLLATAKQHRCTHLGWTVAARNTRGQAFYERLGATVVDRGAEQWQMELAIPD